MRLAWRILGWILLALLALVIANLTLHALVDLLPGI